MSGEGCVVEAPLLSQDFLAHLQEHHGQQWEVKFLQPAAEQLLDRMLAYVGYARLTSHNKYLLRGLFEKWAVGERAEKLLLLSESGGFPK